MSHKLMRLQQSLTNTPLLADKGTLDSVFQYLNDRNAGVISVEEIKAESESRSNNYENIRFIYNEDTQTAVMNIEGPLSYKPITMFGFDCGGANYTHLKEDVEAAIELGAKTIVWQMDSGGGEALGMTRSAKYIRNLLDENEVHLMAYVDGISASACYGLASAAHEIIASPDSELGSIGVVVQLVNDSKALEKKGFERTFLYKGDDKVPFNEDGEWRDGFIEELNNKIQVCYDDFVSLVAENRSLDVQAVIDTQAKTYYAADAVALGLCDKVMSPEEFYTYLADASQNRMENKMNIERIFRFDKKEDKINMANAEQFEEVKTLAAALQASLDESASTIAAQAELITAMEEQATSMKAEVEGLQEQIKALESVKAEMAAQAEQMKLNARQEKLAAVVAADKVEGLMASLVSLDDASFEAVVEGFTAQAEAVEQSALFQELGSDEEASEPVVDVAAEATRAAMRKRV